jgi:hypothetical protein
MALKIARICVATAAAGLLPMRRAGRQTDVSCNQRALQTAGTSAAPQLPRECLPTVLLDSMQRKRRMEAPSRGRKYMPCCDGPVRHVIWVRIAGAIPLARSITSFVLTTSRRMLTGAIGP